MVILMLMILMVDIHGDVDFDDVDGSVRGDGDVDVGGCVHSYVNHIDSRFMVMVVVSNVYTALC